MSALAETHGTVNPPAKKRAVLVPSIITGLVVGLVAAIIAGVIVHQIASPNYAGDATLTAGYLAFAIFFLVGMGAFNFPIHWGLGRPDTTHAGDLENAGQGEGVWRYFRFCTDHKVVGIQYLVTVLVLFLVGGVASWMIRLEQSQSGAKFFTPSTYNTIVSMHGLIMIATTIIMISSTFGNFIMPIMIGARDMAFPRLNALSYWTLFPVVPILLSAIVLGGIPTGWTGYAPLADQAQLGMDAYCVTIILFGTSIALGAINMAATVITMRAPGMTWGRCRSPFGARCSRRRSDCLCSRHSSWRWSWCSVTASSVDLLPGERRRQQLALRGALLVHGSPGGLRHPPAGSRRGLRNCPGLRP